MTDNVRELRREIRDLEDRVDELESIIAFEFDYSFHEPYEAQEVDCHHCGHDFKITVYTGLICPNCENSVEQYAPVEAPRRPAAARYGVVD